VHEATPPYQLHAHCRPSLSLSERLRQHTWTEGFIRLSGEDGKYVLVGNGMECTYRSYRKRSCCLLTNQVCGVGPGSRIKVQLVYMYM